MLGSCAVTRIFGRLLLVAALLTEALGAGCGNDEETSPASLKGLLPPPSQIGPLKLEVPFEWDNPTDFIVQGTVLPQTTAPSEAVSKMDDAGFQAAAGDLLQPRGGGEPVNVDVARFDSSEGATQARDYLHSQDLQQPCAAACSVNPRALTIKGIPGATAVHQVPIKGNLPPGIFPFEAFAAEFVIGSDVFYAYASGHPGDIPPSAFERGVRAIYEHASQQAE